MEDDDLDHLMARLADGDRRVFTVVFQKLWPRVRALCASILNNSDDAEDAAQQAMEKFLTRASDYDRTRPALPWALSIAAWECRTLARWRQRRREVTEQGDERIADATEDAFVQRDLGRAALEALGTLSQNDRDALIASYIHEAGDSTAAGRKRRQRALERLRGAFRRLYGTE